MTCLRRLDMNFMWKCAVALSVAVASLGAVAAPAQAQYYGGDRDGWRGDDRRGEWRRDDRRWDNRRWDNRRHWNDKRHWRGDRDGYYRPAYRQRCWNEWTYSPYSHRRVRVRVCR
jgi:hypothetical protein